MPSTAGIIRMRVLFEGGSYLRKYGNYLITTEFACQDDSHCNGKGSCITAVENCACDEGWTEFYDCTFCKFQTIIGYVFVLSSAY